MKNFNINLNKFSLGLSIFQPPSLHSILYLLYPFIFLIPKIEYSVYLFLSCIITSLYSTIEYHLSLSCVKIFSWCVLNYCPWWILEQPLRFIFLINKLPFYLNSVMLTGLFNTSVCPQQPLNYLVMNGMILLNSDVACSFSYLKRPRLSQR